MRHPTGLKAALVAQGRVVGGSVDASDLCLKGSVEQDVGGLDVAVNDTRGAVVVEVAEASGSANRNAHPVGPVQGTTWPTTAPSHRYVIQ